MKLALVGGRPAPASIAPYIYLVTKRAKQLNSISSIFRGEWARALLHKLGLHTQAEIYRDPAYAGKANPPGHSSHELFSDGNAAYRGVRDGAPIPEWQVGVDSGADTDAARQAITKAAAFYGWHVVHPYDRAVEYHHWSFAKQPKPKNKAQTLLIIAIRARLVLAAKRA